MTSGLFVQVPPICIHCNRHVTWLANGKAVVGLDGDTYVSACLASPDNCHEIPE